MRIRSSTYLARAAMPTSLTATPDSLAISMLNDGSPCSLHRPAAAFTRTTLGVRARLASGERASRLISRVVALVGVHDVTYQPVPHHIVAGQPGEMNIGETFEDRLDDAQATGLSRWQVDLGDVAGNHHL